MNEIKFEKVSLRKLVKIKNGKDHQELKTGIYPVYGSGGIIRYVDKYMYDKESILLPRKGSLNNIQFASKPFWTVDTCYYTEVNEEKVLPYYLFKILSRYDIEMLNTGSAVPSMTFEKYYSIEIKLPSKNYQTKVVNQLKSYDDLIENNQKQIKLLEEAAQRLYKEWFVDLRFPGHENVKIIDGVPEGWENCTLSDVIDFNPKVVFSKGKFKQCVPMSALSTSSMTINSSEFTLTTSTSGSKFQNGDTLLARITPCLENGKIGFVNNIESSEGAIGSTEFIVMRSKKLNPYMVYLLSRTNNFRKAAINSMTGSDGRQRVQVDIIKAYPYKLPSENILHGFSEIVKPIFSAVSICCKQCEKLSEARDRLLSKLMSGEIEL